MVLSILRDVFGVAVFLAFMWAVVCLDFLLFVLIHGVPQ